MRYLSNQRALHGMFYGSACGRLRALPTLVLAALLCISACRAFDTSCDNADVYCDLQALWLYNAPCHARDWTTFYGATTNITVAESVVQELDSGFVVAGKSRDTFGSPLIALTSPGTRSIFAAKFDEDGALVWNTFLGESGDRPVRMTATGDGYIVTGMASLSFGSPLQAFSGANDGIIAKLDLNGNLLWHLYVGTAGNESLAGIAADGNGNYYIVGRSSANIPNAGPIVINNTDPGTDQIFAMAINSQGTPLWQSHIGGTGTEVGVEVASSSGGVLLGALGSAVFNASFNQELNAFSAGGAFHDYIVVALDSSGNYQWHTFQGATATNDDLALLSVLPDGRILAGGQSQTNWGSPANAHPDPGAQPAITLFTLSSTGALLWNSFYGNAGAAGSNLASAFPGNASDELVFAGVASATFGSPIRPYQGGNDLVLGAIDANTGALRRHSFFGGATNELAVPPAAIRSCDNGVFISGGGDGNFGTPIAPYSGTGFQGLHVKVGPSEGF